MLRVQPHRVVLQPLAHLLAVGGQHQAVAHEVLEGGLVEQRRGQHHEGVEPAARLVYALRHEVRREVGLRLRVSVIQGRVRVGFKSNIMVHLQEQSG